MLQRTRMHDHGDHGHSHEHGHGGHAHGLNLKSVTRAFYIGIGLNLVYTIIEFLVGYFYNSLALISDAAHNLSDVISLMIALAGMKLAQKAASMAYTYGYKKASILASLINAVLLLLVVIGILKEAIERLAAPPEALGMVIIGTALIGVAINTFSAFLFAKNQKEDINVKGAFLHLMVDALVSVGVVISGLIIYYTGWDVMDPIISIVIAVVILFTTWSLLSESVTLTLDGVPKDIDLKRLRTRVMQHPEVEDLHHMHVWALSSMENAMTAHLVLKDRDKSLIQIDRIKAEVRHILEQEKVTHATLEVEAEICQEADYPME